MKLTWKQKNALLAASTLLLLLLSWNLAFRKTASEWLRHRELMAATNSNAALADQPGYLRSLNGQLDRLLDSYRVDSMTWKSDLWLTASNIAEQKQIEVDFEPAATPSLNAQTPVMQQTIRFSGHFVQLVALVDTLEKITGNGQVSSLHFKIDDASDKPDRLILLATFCALPGGKSADSRSGVK